MTTPTSDLIELVDLRIRRGGADDLGFVIDTWGRSLRGEYPDARTTDFVDGIRRGIDRRLRAGARIFVAHPAAEPTLILGWACAGESVIHYVYVRDDYRRGGFARRLIEETGFAPPLHVDAMTDACREIRRTHRDKIRYLPNP